MPDPQQQALHVDLYRALHADQYTDNALVILTEVRETHSGGG